MRERLPSLLAALEHGLLERETPVRLALLAALAGEHVLLIGPPGTAKSALALRLHGAFANTRYFERLLTRFSTPEELFGPLSLKALEDDRYERLIDGFLPTAGIAFLDEVFKANSAILNALLTLLNEREFDNGTRRLPTPLISVVAASNEVPDDESLQAFHDRFLVRVPVAPVADANFGALLALEDVVPNIDTPIAPAEREALSAAAVHVGLSDAFVAACATLRTWLAQERQGVRADVAEVGVLVLLQHLPQQGNRAGGTGAAGRDRGVHRAGARAHSRSEANHFVRCPGSGGDPSGTASAQPRAARARRSGARPSRA